MNKELIIRETKKFIRRSLRGEASGHDWWHAFRVWKTAKEIARKEKVNSFIVELAALLHDIADWKFHNGNKMVGIKKAKEWLEKLKLIKKTISQVCEIIKETPFRGAWVKTKIKTKEGMVMQDADRLDAIGAIGIARVFAYGSFEGREIYNPEIKAKRHKTFEEYKRNKGTAINHFYEKLLLLKDRMNTKTAKKIAEKRHKFMEQFLKEFFKEWNLKDL